MLVQNGADVNAKNKNGSTPLIWASCNGLTDICGMLVQNGADVNAKSKE